MLVSQASYYVQLNTRGVVYNNSASSQRLTEPQICSQVYCLYISMLENDLLNLGLGDSNVEIYQNLLKSDERELAYIFYRLDRLQNTNY